MVKYMTFRILIQATAVDYSRTYTSYSLIHGGKHRLFQDEHMTTMAFSIKYAHRLYCDY